VPAAVAGTVRSQSAKTYKKHVCNNKFFQRDRGFGDAASSYPIVGSLTPFLFQNSASLKGRGTVSHRSGSFRNSGDFEGLPLGANNYHVVSEDSSAGGWDSGYQADGPYFDKSFLRCAFHSPRKTKGEKCPDSRSTNLPSRYARIPENSLPSKYNDALKNLVFPPVFFNHDW